MPAAGIGVEAVDIAGDIRSDHDADPLRDQREERLCPRARFGIELAIDVDMARHDQELVADAVADDAQPHHRHNRGIARISADAQTEAPLPRGPADHHTSTTTHTRT